MDYLNKLSDKDLFEIGLIRKDNEVKIYIPNDANIYNMTLGGYLSKEHINNPALIFEDKNGNVLTILLVKLKQCQTALHLSSQA